MRVVVADTGPLHYLVLIEAIELLPRLFGKVLVPEIVRIELDRPRTPAPVRTWLRTNPAWLEQRPMPPGAPLLSPKLGEAEQGSQFKGYEPYQVQELVLSARVVHYRRERLLTPDGTDEVIFV